jgi:iron complex outermembrane receptor protein
MISSRTVPLIFACLLHALAAPVLSEGTNVTGRVVDANSGIPLEGANVTSGEGGTATDREGRFALAISTGAPVTVTHVGYEALTIYPSKSELTVRLKATAVELQEVVVVGGLRAQALEDVTASVTVLGGPQLYAVGGSHLQDLTQSVPNLSWAGGTSRPRYFQIRGIGERSQFAGEGPPSFSVGFILDDVDLSGLGPAAVLLDMDQIEVYKGPQSTIFGPNAMAGLINLQSADPSQSFGCRAKFTVGSDDLIEFSGSVNVPLTQRAALRAAYHTGRADGFRENRFLDAEDTNRRRESFARAKLRYVTESGLILLGTLFRANMNNGYDAWTPDNNEDLVTFSDNPGKDHQKTTAGSVKAELKLERIDANLVAISSLSSTRLEYSYDGDWGNDQFWLQEPYNFDPEQEGWRYDFFDRTVRERDVFTQEVRLLSERLVNDTDNGAIGLYFRRLEETDDANGYLFGGDATDLIGTFGVDNLAFYMQYGREIFPRLRLSLNLRGDRSSITYDGVTNSGAESVAFDTSEWLLGGKAALTYALSARTSGYGLVSRGYRAGGVNQHPYLAVRNRPFDPEHVLNFEGGFRITGSKSTTSLALFHMLRSDQQVSLSSQQNPGDPNSFFYFTSNAASGRSTGIEFEQSYRLNHALRLFGSLAYLDSHVDGYTFLTATNEVQALGDRAAAYAPEYSVRIGGEFDRGEGLFGRLELTATDGYFFSDSHNQIADAYQLVNGSLGYRSGNWEVALWGRNLLDERYGTRGFYFGLEPPNYADKLYQSYGDPRQLGLRTTVGF